MPIKFQKSCTDIRVYDDLHGGGWGDLRSCTPSDSVVPDRSRAWIALAERVT